MAYSRAAAAMKPYRKSGRTCRYSGNNAKYSETSAMLGYGLKMAKMPSRVVITKSGCLLVGAH